MDVLHALIDDVRAAPRDVIHHAADMAFVARNRARAEHHRVVVLQLDVLVIVNRDPRQRRHRLALRSRGDADDVAAGLGADVAVAHLHACRDAQVAEALRDLANSPPRRGRRTPRADRTARRGRPARCMR